MNTFEISKTHASHAGSLEVSIGCGCCPGDGSPAEGAGVGSEILIAIAHPFESVAA